MPSNPATLRAAVAVAAMLATLPAALAFGSFDRGGREGTPLLQAGRTLAQFSRNEERIDGRRIIVIDGDTIALPCAFPGPGCAEKVRLRDIDAPETSKPRCESEFRAGLAAKERLAGLLRNGQVSLARTGADVYGRTLGVVMVDGVDVGRILMRDGLALPYSPDRRHREARLAHWCGRR